ncbi:hypothetical protein BDR03DRAFT_976445 [Suillus americanus]|nr:hypothetical protein BDR03DRAFT_976445 [Suillus americanus]
MAHLPRADFPETTVFSGLVIIENAVNMTSYLGLDISNPETPPSPTPIPQLHSLFLFFFQVPVAFASLAFRQSTSLVTAQPPALFRSYFNHHSPQTE